MNTLTELNAFSDNTTIEYTDQRLTNIEFDRETATNQSLTVNESETFDLPVGIEVTDVINYDTAEFSMSVDLSTAPSGTTLDWGTLPAGITAATPSAGVYSIQYIKTVDEWNTVKTPSINLPDDYFGTFVFTVDLDYYSQETGYETVSYTVTMTVLEVTILTTPFETTYDTDSVTDLTNTPTISDVDVDYPGAVWTIIGQPNVITSIDTWSRGSVTGGTFTVDAGTKEFTISGTRAQVNASLAALSIDSNSSTIDFTVTYTLSNNQDSSTDVKTQSIKNSDIEFLSNISTPIVYYTEDTDSAVTGGPTITDTSSDGSGTYTLEIYPNETAAITTISATGSGGSTSFNNSTKTLTITGTRDQVNSYINNISIDPGTDYDQLFLLYYELTLPSPRVGTAVKIQQLAASSNDDEVSNLDQARTYQSNTFNYVFASNTPQIVDLDDNASAVYTVVLDCSQGDWELVSQVTPYIAGASLGNPLSISGVRSVVNAALTKIRFYPDHGVNTTINFTWTQFKDSVEQLSQTVALTNAGTGVYTGARTVDYTVSGTFTPTYEDSKYGIISDLLIVGAGGGGGLGGGGGGQVKELFNVSIPSTTAVISVGSGGTAGRSNDADALAGGVGQSSSAFGYTALGGGGGGIRLNGFPFDGGYGGYSYAKNDDSTQYGSLNGAEGLWNGYTTYVYSGGAGSGGTAVREYSIGAAIPAFPENSRAGNGAFGAAITGYYATAGESGYGFGGGGGASGFGLRLEGGRGGYRDSEGTNYGNGARKYTSGTLVNTSAPTKPDKIVSGVRDPSVAGGGGGGGARNYNATHGPAQGGDGVVRFRIVAR